MQILQRGILHKI